MFTGDESYSRLEGYIVDAQVKVNDYGIIKLSPQTFHNYINANIPDIPITDIWIPYAIRAINHFNKSVTMGALDLNDVNKIEGGFKVVGETIYYEKTNGEDDYKGNKNLITLWVYYKLDSILHIYNGIFDSIVLNVRSEIIDYLYQQIIDTCIQSIKLPAVQTGQPAYDFDVDQYILAFVNYTNFPITTSSLKQLQNTKKDFNYTHIPQYNSEIQFIKDHFEKYNDLKLRINASSSDTAKKLKFLTNLYNCIGSTTLDSSTKEQNLNVIRSYFDDKDLIDILYRYVDETKLDKTILTLKDDVLFDFVSKIKQSTNTTFAYNKELLIHLILLDIGAYTDILTTHKAITDKTRELTNETSRGILRNTLTRLVNDYRDLYTTYQKDSIKCIDSKKGDLISPKNAERVAPKKLIATLTETLTKCSPAPTDPLLNLKSAMNLLGVKTKSLNMDSILTQSENRDSDADILTIINNITVSEPQRPIPKDGAKSTKVPPLETSPSVKMGTKGILNIPREKFMQLPAAFGSLDKRPMDDNRINTFIETCKKHGIDIPETGNNIDSFRDMVTNQCKKINVVTELCVSNVPLDEQSTTDEFRVIKKRLIVCNFVNGQNPNTPIAITIQMPSSPVEPSPLDNLDESEEYSSDDYTI